MQLHNLKRKTKNKKKRVVGRGGARGKTSGRGTKGQNARAGHKKRPEIRDMIKKLPKLRGYRFNSTEQKPTAVNVGALNIFDEGATLSPKDFLVAGLIRRKGGKLPLVKILGTGELSKKFTVEGCVVSKVAREKIEKAGGVIK